MRDLHLALTSLQTLFRESGLQWLAVEVNPRAISRPEQALSKLRNVRTLLGLRPAPSYLHSKIQASLSRAEVAANSI